MPARTLLVVDDDPDIRRMAAISLERIGGFRVVLAADADQALELATRSPPDLVLLDVSMPGKDGPATLAALRAQSATATVPVVFFTAAAQAEELAGLRARGDPGVVGVLTKPFDVATLSARIRDILASAGQG